MVLTISMKTFIRQLASFGCAIFVGLISVHAELASPAAAGQVGMIVSKLLEERHYNARRLDETMAKEMLKNYLNALDYTHLFFLQSDVDGFQHFAAEFDTDLIAADLKPALEIYQVYSNRVEEVCATIKDLLQENYAFATDETMLLDRHEAPWPATELDRRSLLRQRIKFELLEERLNKAKPEEAVKTVTRRYDTIRRNLHENDLDTIVGVYLNSLAMLYDPHTNYLPPESAEDFAIKMRLSLSGIGAVLRSEDGFAKVMSIVPGGPAGLDKRLQVNDRIAGVAQGDGPMVDVMNLKLSKVVEQIRGKKGTVVRLSVLPAAAPDSSTRTEIVLTRDEIKLTEEAAKAKIITKPTCRIGYIDLPSFYMDPKRGPDSTSSSRDVRQLLAKLRAEKVGGLILDLRRNTGGSLPEAIALTGLFIDQGPVVQVKDTQGRISIGGDTDPGTSFDGPMIVLVSHISASASEILAAALQDYGRAIIVGDQSTFGKGTVQQVVPLDELLSTKPHDSTGIGELKLTVQKFYRVNGGSTQSYGVVPDIVLPDTLDVMKIGENYLPHYLPYDKVPALKINRWSQSAPPVEDLRRLAASRVSHDPEFRYLVEDTERLKAKSEEKTVSLNEVRRLAEKLDNDKRAETRKKERAARSHAPLPTTEITLASLSNTTNHVAAITQQVLDDAAANAKTNEPKKVDDGKPTPPEPDPIFDEALNILTDYVQLHDGLNTKN